MPYSKYCSPPSYEPTVPPVFNFTFQIHFLLSVIFKTYINGADFASVGESTTEAA